MNDKLLAKLIALETELHLNSTRKNSARLEELLHPEFIEIGRSGKFYSREDVLVELAGEAELPEIHSSDFELRALGESLYLLTYVSAHKGKELHRLTRRTSLWIEDGGNWLLRYHQGSPLTD